MALDRFVSRRLPHTVYSDNAATFQAARRELAEICTILNDPQTSHYFAHRGITWKFIATRAAWWERMVGTTKRCIRKVLGKRQVDDEKLKSIERPTDISLLCTSRHHMEIYCPTGRLVGRMVGAYGRHN